MNELARDITRRCWQRIVAIAEGEALGANGLVALAGQFAKSVNEVENDIAHVEERLCLLEQLAEIDSSNPGNFLAMRLRNTLLVSSRNQELIDELREAERAELHARQECNRWECASLPASIVPRPDDVIDGHQRNRKAQVEHWDGEVRERVDRVKQVTTKMILNKV